MSKIYDPILARIKRNMSLCRAATKLVQAADRRQVHTDNTVRLVQRVETLKDLVLKDCERAGRLGATEEELECLIKQA